MMEVHGVSPTGQNPSRQPKKRRQPGDGREAQPGKPQPPRVSKHLSADAKSLIVDIEA